MTDVFEVLQKHLEHYGALGKIVICDLNGRIGRANDFLGHNFWNTQLKSDFSGLIDYVPALPCDKTTEEIDIKNRRCGMISLLNTLVVKFGLM